MCASRSPPCGAGCLWRTHAPGCIISCLIFIKPHTHAHALSIALSHSCFPPKPRIRTLPAAAPLKCWVETMGTL
jgi:hypothetical protein